MNRLTYLFSLRQWRNRCLGRDNSTCQVCGTQTRPCVHHIAPSKLYPEFHLAVENGITVCPKCHFNEMHSDNGLALLREFVEQCHGAKKRKPSLKVRQPITGSGRPREVGKLI